MSSFLYRLGHLCVRRRRWVLAAWAAVVLVAVLLASTVGGSTTENLSIPGTESQRAGDLLEKRFPAESGSDAQVVLAAPAGRTLDEASLRSAVNATAGALRQAPGVADVSAPLAEGTVSPERTVTFLSVHYSAAASDVTDGQASALTDATEGAREAGLRVEMGGEVVDEHSSGGSSPSELIGLGVALVVLVISFGSLIAAGLPLVTALLGVFAALMAIQVLAGFTSTSSSAPTLAIMIGLAVGIDYALFIITRHRQHLSEGLTPAESAARATATAGGAVVFAGLTVIIALAGLTVVGIPFIGSLGIAAALAVVFAVLLAVTLIPALLGFVGPSIDRWRIGRSRTGTTEALHDTWSARWARAVTRRPGRSLLAGLVILLVLATPALSLRLGMLDAGSLPAASTERQAHDLLAESFGPGFNGPLTAVVDLQGSTDRDAALAAVTAAAAADPGVLSASTAITNAAGDTAVVSVVPRTGPSSKATSSLVHHLRDDVFPQVEKRTGATIAVTGPTAANIDITDKLGSALPVFMGIVIGLSSLLLLVAFRSIVVPIKAAIGILLSIGASFGVLVAVFQWGWLKDVVGLQETVPVVSFLPVMMFAILFGLSMDYEVFILSRIREDFMRTGNAQDSVVTGLAGSARVITAAALIMISVFGSFVLGDEPVIKMFGVGFAAAVLLDATIVRMIIVPSTMALLDKANWWLPRWLDRALPNLDVEGERLMEQLEAQVAATGADRVAGTDSPAARAADVVHVSYQEGSMHRQLS